MIFMIWLCGQGIVRQSAKIRDFDDANVWKAATCSILNATQFNRCRNAGGGAVSCTYHAVYTVDIAVEDQVIPNVVAYADGGKKYAVYRVGDFEKYKVASVHTCYYDKTVKPLLDPSSMIVQLEFDASTRRGAKILRNLSIVIFVVFMSFCLFACIVPLLRDMLCAQRAKIATEEKQ